SHRRIVFVSVESLLPVARVRPSGLKASAQASSEWDGPGTVLDVAAESYRQSHAERPRPTASAGPPRSGPSTSQNEHQPIWRIGHVPSTRASRESRNSRRSGCKWLERCTRNPAPSGVKARRFVLVFLGSGLTG